MRRYTPLNDNGRRAKTVLMPILSEWKTVREIGERLEQLSAAQTAKNEGAAILERRLHAAQVHLRESMRRAEHIIARSSALSPAQVMILTLRYVQGCGWSAIAQVAQMNRARLFQEHRTGLNGIDFNPPT